MVFKAGPPADTFGAQIDCSGQLYETTKNVFENIGARQTPGSSLWLRAFWRGNKNISDATRDVVNRSISKDQNCQYWKWGRYFANLSGYLDNLCWIWRNLLLLSFADAVPSGWHSFKDRSLNAIRVTFRHKFQISCWPVREVREETKQYLHTKTCCKISHEDSVWPKIGSGRFRQASSWLLACLVVHTESGIWSGFGLKIGSGRLMVHKAHVLR